MTRAQLSGKTGWIVLVGGLLVGLVAAGIARLDRPPISELEASRSAISRAEKVSADRYAHAWLRRAITLYDSANTAWQQENVKWLINRDFASVRNLAEAATRQAQQAASQSVVVQDSLRLEVHRELVVVEAQIEEFRSRFGRLPLGDRWRREFAAGEMRVMETRTAAARGDFLTASALLREGASMIARSTRGAEQWLNGYLESLPVWQEWADETIAMSRSQSIAVIIVDKIEEKCLVYHNGRLMAEYDAEFGRNWIGDKRHQGDKATPEGRYRVAEKRGPGQTRYYKALLINYPNSDDRMRYRREIRNGSLPESVPIGGLIEIHGAGGRGVHWTDGCVALFNADMDHLFELARVGTPVTIVGWLGNRE